MDQKERSADFFSAIKTSLQGWQRGIWTAMPAIVQSYNAADNTVSAQPAIQALVLQQDPKTGAQKQASVSMPLLIKVPVVFPGGGGFHLTFPIAAGDEVLVVFASRCIDAWWQSGGVQGQIEQRAHDLSDGIAIPGLHSVPNVPGGISGSTTQLRSSDGSTFVEIASGGHINLHASTVTITGNLVVNGDVTGGAGTGDQIGLRTHKHGTGTAASGTVAPTAGT